MSTRVIDGTRAPTPTVLIAGGGVAAVEALLALRELAGGRLRLELLSPAPDFVYRPLSVAEPFGLAEPRRVPLAEVCSEHGAVQRSDALADVDADRRVVRTAGGALLDYDFLLLATGAAAEEVLPGALTFRGPPDVEAYRALLAELEQGSVTRLAFAVPPSVNWSLPLYELALLTAAHAASRRIENLELTFVTHEARPLGLFGRRTSDSMAELLAGAGVTLLRSKLTAWVDSGQLVLAGGERLAVDRVVALPRLRAPELPGVPQGPSGFIAIDGYGRVEGLERVYAAGDATWYPIKQGGLAAQQADAAASAIAADAGLGVAARPFRPALRGILLTGGAPQYLRGDPNGNGNGSDAPLWRPVAKVAGRHIAPYLAGRFGGEDLGVPLRDVPRARSALTQEASLALALEAADANAGWGDYEAALRWLQVAEQLNVVLPPAYARTRLEWRALRDAQREAAAR